MTKKQKDIVQEFCKLYKKYNWRLLGNELHQNYKAKMKPFYRHHINLKKLKDVCIESGSLCLAFEAGYMLWIIEDRISFDYDPTNPLQTGGKT